MKGEVVKMKRKPLSKYTFFSLGLSESYQNPQSSNPEQTGSCFIFHFVVYEHNKVLLLVFTVASRLGPVFPVHVLTEPGLI